MGLNGIIRCSNFRSQFITVLFQDFFF
jgi:hypothetical protein